MSEYKTKFLKVTENLINELLRILPNDVNITLFKEKYYLIKKVNSTLVINSFVKYVIPFKQEIMEKNEKYFLENGTKEDLGEKKYKYSIDLKENWKNLNEQNKEIIWKYFQVLLVLTEKYLVETVSKQN